MKLGFVVSEATVSRYMPHKPAKPDQLKRWVAFLHNHKDAIAAMDFFTSAHGMNPLTLRFLRRKLKLISENFLLRISDGA